MFLQVEQSDHAQFNSGAFDVEPFFHMSSRKLSIFYIIPFKLMDKLQRNVILKPEEYSSRTEYKVEYMGVYFSEFQSEEKGGWKVKDQTEGGLVDTYIIHP